MSNSKWVVRVILLQDQLENTDLCSLVESLRYMGIVEILDNENDRMVFELKPPSKVDSKTWASQNSERMNTMGFMAASAPEWKNESQQ